MRPAIIQGLANSYYIHYCNSVLIGPNFVQVRDDNVRSLFFGDYISPEGERIYDEVQDLKQLTSVMEG